MGAHLKKLTQHQDTRNKKLFKKVAHNEKHALRKLIKNDPKAKTFAFPKSKKKKTFTRKPSMKKKKKGVRFTPRGSEKRAPRQFEQFEQKSKLALGTIKNGFRLSDLPLEGPKKERRGNSSNLSKSQN